MADTTYSTKTTDFLAQTNANLNAILTESVVIPARTAADGTETIVFRVPSTAQSAIINKISFIPSAAITGAATNFQTLSVRKIHGVTASAITGATTFVTTASQVQFTAKDLYIQYNNNTALNLVASDSLTIKNTSTASGAVLPEMVVVVEYQLTFAIN